MKAPFEKFRVATSAVDGKFIVEVDRLIYSRILDARIFIETAIREAIERSAASSTTEEAAPGGGKC